MQTVTQPSKDIPVVGTADVLVIGGGPAGVAAATAAARMGVDVLLVERYGCLGGLASGGMVLYMDGLFDREGNRCIGGICWDLLERLRDMDGLAERSPTDLHVDSELFKVVSDDACTGAGVAMRLHSWAVDVIRDGNHVAGVILESKSGREALLGRICIDATGDGDIAAFSGAGYDSHRMRIGLNYKIGGVDAEKFRSWEKQNPDKAKDLRNRIRASGGWPIGLGETPHSDIGVFWVNVLGMARRGSDQSGEPGADIFDGELDAVDVEDLTYSEIELRKSMMISLEHYRKNAPGFENVRLLSIASQLGVRDSRRILGIHKLSRADLDTGKEFDDAIGMTGMTSKDGYHLQVPYASLVPREIDGLLCAGRCISVGTGLIHPIRIIPPCMMTGQAAGTAAALCVEKGVEPRNLDTGILRARLKADGVLLPQPTVRV